MNLLKISAVGASCAALSIVLAGCAGSPGPGTSGTPGTSDSANSNSITLDVKSSEPIDADAATLVVFGMSCPQCASNVDKQLKRIDGVADIRTDLGSGDVIVEFAEGSARPTPAELGRAVELSGFTLQRIIVE